MDIWHTFCRSTTKFGSVRGLANQHLFPEFRELWFAGPVIPCGDMHQSFANPPYTCKVVFRQLPSVLSVHCIVGRLAASFLYKCPASRGSSLRQHGLLVVFVNRFSILCFYFIFYLRLFCSCVPLLVDCSLL